MLLPLSFASLVAHHLVVFTSAVFVCGRDDGSAGVDSGANTG
jgi:hypothetical protein